MNDNNNGLSLHTHYPDGAIKSLNNGNRTERQQPGGTTRYTYNSVNQLTKIEYPTYTEQLYYDKAGNRSRRITDGTQEEGDEINGVVAEPEEEEDCRVIEKEIGEKMFKKEKKYVFSEIINEVKKVYFERGAQALYQDGNWCVYVLEEDLYPNLNTECYIDEWPDVTDDDEEIYPEFIENNNYKLAYTGEMIQDVIISALSRKENATNEELMTAIDYYDEHDTFMEI